MARGLKWQPHEYYTYNLLNNKELTLEEMRAEYNRLRVLANSRLERFKTSEFKKSQAYKENLGQYELTARHYKKAQLAKKLYQVSRFIGAEQGSIQGQRRIMKRTIARLHESGYDFINKNNIRQFMDFMEDMRIRAGGKLLDSDRVAEVFGIAKEKGVDSKSLERDFDLWLANSDELKDMSKLKGKHSSDDYLARLNKIKKPKNFRYSKDADQLLSKLPKKNKRKIKELLTDED